MEWLYEWITNPSTLINIVVLIFGVGTTWANLNNRIKKVEEKSDRIDSAKIEAKLAEIQTDLAWIKNELNKLDK